MLLARIWRLHPDQLLTTDVRTYHAMIRQLQDEADKQRKD